MGAIANDWLEPLKPEFAKPYYAQLYKKVKVCLTAFALQYYLFLLNPASSRYSGCPFKYGSLSPQMV